MSRDFDGKCFISAEHVCNYSSTYLRQQRWAKWTIWKAHLVIRARDLCSMQGADVQVRKKRSTKVENSLF